MPSYVNFEESKKCEACEKGYVKHDFVGRAARRLCKFCLRETGVEYRNNRDNLKITFEEYTDIKIMSGKLERC